MKQTRRYEFEGLSIDIPFHFDEKTGIYIEDYPDFVESPIWTPEGYRVMFAGEDACDYAQESSPGGCPDCGSCKFYQSAAEHTWFGVCKNDSQKRTLNVTEENFNEENC